MEEHPIETAFRTSYRGYLGLALKRLRSIEEAEEAVQESFRLAWEHRDQFRGGACSSWIWSIVANECTTRLRQRGRRHESAHEPLSVLNEPSAPSRVLHDIQREQELALVIRALPRIKPVLRKCVGGILAGGAGMDMRHGTTKSRRHRAIAQLRRALKLP